MIEESNELKIIDVLPINKQVVDIAEQIVQEPDISKVQDMIHLFNLYQTKKNVLRVMKLNGLLDTVSDQMIERFEKKPGEFSNADLLNYLQVTQSAIDRANKSINLVDETPAIHLQQNNVNINLQPELSRESKTKVTEAVKAILERIQNMSELATDSNTVDVTDTVIVKENIEESMETVD